MVLLNPAQTCSRSYKYRGGGETLSCDGLAVALAISLNECRGIWRLFISAPCLSGLACLFGSDCNGSLHLDAWCWRTPPSFFPILFLSEPHPASTLLLHLSLLLSLSPVFLSPSVSPSVCPPLCLFLYPLCLHPSLCICLLSDSPK